MFFRKILLALSLLLCTGLPLVAAQSWESVSGEIMPCSGADCAKDAVEVAALPQADFKDEFLPKIARFMLYGMATVAFVVFSAAGAILVLGWGSEDQTKKAKNAMIWGLVGLSFAAAAYTLVRGVLDLDLVDSGSATESVASTSSQAAETATTTKKSEAEPAVNSTAAAKSNSAICSLNTSSLPATCYGDNSKSGAIVKDGQTQGKNANSCTGVLTTLQPLCDDLSVRCEMKTIQTALFNQNMYFDPSNPEKKLATSCSKADGKYGQCTKTAIENYYKKKCSASPAAKTK